LNFAPEILVARQIVGGAIVADGGGTGTIGGIGTEQRESTRGA
jgi:hypothetical protein